jgi:nitrogen regulatory protein PII
MYMILLVLHDYNQLDEVLQAWEDAGVGGITILPSTGLARIRQSALRDDLPLIPSLEDLLGHQERLNRTIFTIVNDDATVDLVVAATESVTGKLDLPDTGILAVMPLARVFGLQKRSYND